MIYQTLFKNSRLAKILTRSFGFGMVTPTSSKTIYFSAQKGFIMRKLLTLAVFLVAPLFLAAGSAGAVESPWVSARYVGGDQVRLYWAAVPNASYQVFYGPADNPQAHGLVVGEGGGATIGGLFKNTTYVFAAKSIRDGEVSGLSNSVRVRTGTLARKPLPAESQSAQMTTSSAAQPPQVKYQGTMKTDAQLNPANETTGRRGVGRHNLRAVTGPARGQVTLYWNQPNELVSSYNIVYSDTKAMDKWGVLDISGDARSFVVGGLTPGVRYYFKVSGNNTELSPWVSELAK